MLCIARKSMKLYFMRFASTDTSRRRSGPMQVVVVDLDKVFNDSKAGKMQPASYYQHICGTIPADLGAGGDMALDANEDYVYFRVGKTEAAKHLPANAKIENNKVIVWNETVEKPMYVPYAWADNPDNPNLYNKEGLPASPFRTDQ